MTYTTAKVRSLLENLPEPTRRRATNGCGPSGFGYLVPEFDTELCNLHDLAYSFGLTRAEKKLVDRWFVTLLRRKHGAVLAAAVGKSLALISRTHIDPSFRSIDAVQLAKIRRELIDQMIIDLHT